MEIRIINLTINRAGRMSRLFLYKRLDFIKKIVIMCDVPAGGMGSSAVKTKGSANGFV